MIQEYPASREKFTGPNMWKSEWKQIQLTERAGTPRSKPTNSAKRRSEMQGKHEKSGKHMTSEMASSNRRNHVRKMAEAQAARADAVRIEYKEPRYVPDTAPHRRPTYSAPGCVIRGEPELGVLA